MSAPGDHVLELIRERKQAAQLNVAHGGLQVVAAGGGEQEGGGVGASTGAAACSLTGTPPRKASQPREGVPAATFPLLQPVTADPPHKGKPHLKHATVL